MEGLNEHEKKMILENITRSVADLVKSEIISDKNQKIDLIKKSTEQVVDVLLVDNIGKKDHADNDIFHAEVEFLHGSSSATFGAAQKEETEKMRQQRARNYKFFDAPVGMIFSIHNDLEIGSWMDFGMFLQNIMVSARGHGLHTCAQAAFSDYHTIIKEHLRIPDNETVVCGMSMGYADPDQKVNQYRPEREPLSSYANFEYFDGQAE